MPLSKEETEARCGFSIPQEIWDFHPWGNRVVVMREPPAKFYGELEIPTDAQKPINAGTVVKFGPHLCNPDCQGWAPLPPNFESDPDSLVGVAVTFGRWSGEEIHISGRSTLVDNPYDDLEFLLARPVDIWGHNTPKEKEEDESG